MEGWEIITKPKLFFRSDFYLRFNDFIKPVSAQKRIFHKLTKQINSIMFLSGPETSSPEKGGWVFFAFRVTYQV